MMSDQPTERTSSGRGYRITTPSFPECAEMDGFYAEAHRIIEADFADFRGRGGAGIVVADFFAEPCGDAVEVTLRLRHRQNGRYVREKRVVHRWRGANIAPRRRRRFYDIISNFAGKYKRKSEKTRGEDG